MICGWRNLPRGLQGGGTASGARPGTHSRRAGTEPLCSAPSLECALGIVPRSSLSSRKTAAFSAHTHTRVDIGTVNENNSDATKTNLLCDCQALVADEVLNCFQVRHALRDLLLDWHQLHLQRGQLVHQLVLNYHRASLGESVGTNARKLCGVIIQNAFLAGIVSCYPLFIK